MEIESHPCANCGAETRNDRAAGLTYCSACGTGLKAVQAEKNGGKESPSGSREYFCPFCGSTVATEIEIGRTNCQSCESRLPPSVFHEDIADSRTGWYQAFWMVFLLTPLASLPIQFIPRVLPKPTATAIEKLLFGDSIWMGGTMVALVIGALASGFCMTRQRGHTDSRYEQLSLCLGFTMVVLFAYLAFYHWFLW